MTIGANVTGGNGGDGATTSGTNAGGAGGTGIVGAGLTLIVSPGIAVTGGRGGTGTIANGLDYFGAGGVGISGSGLTVTNAGTISGGLSGAATAPARSNAITFTGGANRLELQAATAGGTYAGIVGNVVVQSGTGTLALGGANDKTFDVSTIGSQYQGFTAYEKTGTSTWTLVNTTTAVTPWAINQGTLSISQDGNLGDGSGRLTFGGGTLETTASFSSPRPITLNTAGTIQTDAGVTTILSGVIADGANGAGTLTKTGIGTLVLSGTNTYSGGTAINAGTVQVGAAANLGSGGIIFGGGTGTPTLATTGTFALGRAITLNATGTIQTAAGTTLTADGAITGAGGLTKTGDGTLLLTTGAHTYAGDTTVNAGTLRGGAANTFSAASATFVNGTGVLDLGGFAQAINSVALATGGTITSGALTGAISSSGGTVSTISGPATLATTAGTTISTGDTYSGATTVGTGSILKAGAANGFSPNSAYTVAGTGTLDLNGTGNTVASLASASPAAVVTSSTAGAGTAVLTAGGNNASTTFAGTIQNGAGTVGLAKAGTGTLVLTGTNTYTGGTSIATGGTLQIGAGGTSGSITGNVTNDGALVFNRSDATGFAGLVSGRGTLTQAGTGTLTLTGANTYTGGTLIKGGTLAIDNPNAVGTGTVAMDEGTRLAFLGSGYTFRNAIRFTGATDPTIDSGPGTIALAGPISGSGSLEKTGTGTLVVLADTAYTGDTRVSAGILQVEGAIAASPLTAVASGAGLTGTGRIGGLVVQAGGFVAPGNAATPYGVLTASGPVTLQAGSALLTSVAPGAASRLATAATATVSGATLVVTPAAATYTTPVRLPVLAASGGLTGQFSTVAYTAPVRGLQPSVVYDANTAYVQFGFVQSGNAAGPGTSGAASQDLSSAITSAQALARDRVGAFVTQRVLGSVLTGFNQQISCGSCASGFGMAGSYSLGAQGRRALTEELSLIGGIAFTGHDGGRIRAAGAPILAGLLRYDPAGLGPARPFVDVGGLLSPSQSTSYTRPYAFGDMLGLGTGRSATIGGAVTGRVGYVARLSPQDEVSASAEISRGWQYTGAYSESQAVPNPYPLVSRGGTDVINIAKLGAQVTHLFGTAIEAQASLGVAHGFGLTSGLNATVAGMPLAASVRDSTWAEYGLRISYRLKQDLALDAFALGTLGPKPIRDTIHGGGAIRYLF